MSSRWVIAVACLILSLVPLATTVGAASEEEKSFLALYFSDEELEFFSATRSLKSVASVAENVVVVTAQDIELMNAHTVAEALYNVTGIEMWNFKGPGAGGYASILGSGQNRVTVMLDGVPLQTANNDFHLAVLPVQMIARIEVVKGPASSTWGSSFGGVINVITKSVGSGDRADGTISASVGERDTSDVRAELSARKDRFGLYLYGGRMNSDGVPGGHEFEHDNVFAKVSLDPGRSTRIDVSFYYHASDSVNAEYQPVRDAYNGFELETLLGKADFRTSIAADVDLRFSGWWNRQDDNFFERRQSTDVTTRDGKTLYDRSGFSGNLTWRAGAHVLVAGYDASQGRFEQDMGGPLTIERDTYALFVNDSITAGALCVTPGLRYDHSSLAGGLPSPSLGATWLASRDLLVRALVSRGFHDPMIVRYYDAPPMRYHGNKDLVPEKIWSYEAGAEANLAGLLRVKLTLFYHDIEDILVERVLDVETGEFTTENGGRARTTGGEFEIASNTFKGFVMSGGAHYEQSRSLDRPDAGGGDGTDVYGVNASLSYHGGLGLRSAVKAHYLRWDVPDSWEPDSEGIVVDAAVAKEFRLTGKIALELFANVHNIFNANSYSNRFEQNPDRWLETGVRFTF